MEDTDATFESTSKVWCIFRNVCSPVLAEIFARELKNSRFMRESQDRGSTNTLYETLNSVDKVGKRKTHKKKLIQKAVKTSGTSQINNIDINMEILKQVKTEELLKDGIAWEAVTKLRKLDVKFLLCILLNTVLGIPHNTEIKIAMEKLLIMRNSNVHQDKDNKLLMNSLKEAKTLYTCLGRDTACLQDLEKIFCDPLDKCDPILKDVQQEISSSKRCQMPKHHNHHPAQLTIQNQQIGEHCQPAETVEDLVEFIVQKWVDSGQEPQPIVLYGEPGAGKSSILDSLMHSIAEDQDFKDFLMVVKVDVTVTRTREEFWKKLFMKLKTFFPKELDNSSIERILSRCINKFLFVVDNNFHNTKQLDQLIPFMDRGMWVLSYQGVPEPCTHLPLLRVAPLTEEQVLQILQGITKSEEDRKQISEYYLECEDKELLQTPDMVHIFAEICSELKSSVPFYKLIQHYIYKKVDGTAENEATLIALGQKAFRTIKENKKYYLDSSLDDKLKRVSHPLLEQDHLRGYFFKYRKVEDYVAAKYVVAHPEVACESWLSQPTLFRTVFHIACALWREQRNGIDTNRHFIKEYLEKLFQTDEPQASRGKKRKRNKATSEEDDDDTNRNVFQRWTFLSKIAKDNESNEDVLGVLADCLTQCHTWLFKYTLLTEDLIAGLSLVLRHVQVPPKLTIKMESRTSVEVLSQLWSEFSRHPGLWHNTSVHLTISYTECTAARDESLLAGLCGTICSTTAPLHITEYTGPLLCSETPQFFECTSMAKLSKLDVYVCDLTSLCMVLEQQEVLSSITVKIRLKAEGTQLSKTRRIQLFPPHPPALTIIYFEGLQTLLDNFEQPESLCSLKIYEVFIHQTFSLDLTRFMRLEFLSIQFHCKKSEEKSSWLPLKSWTPHLVQHLRLPTHVGRLLMRNLTFFEDSTASDLAKYFRKLTLQRLVLVDTKLSILKFREILHDLVASSSLADTQTSLATPPKKVVKCQRLDEEERASRRKNKPKGKEVIVTSEVEHLRLFESSTKDQENAYNGFTALVREVYLCQMLSINYSGTDVTIRKDMCGDLTVHCPLPFLDDEMAQHPERQPQLGTVLEVLALAQAITLTDTNLSYAGTLYLLKHLKEKKGSFGSIEPFRLTIFSCLERNCSKSVAEVQHSLMREIKNDGTLQQFNFICEKRCHFFKKAISGSIIFNNKDLSEAKAS